MLDFTFHETNAECKMIRKIILTSLLVSLTVMCPKVLAQEKHTAQISSNDDGARYEIIQSEISVKVTIKLDKQSGKSWLLTSFSGEKPEFNAWDELKREAVTPAPNNSKRINYQVFTSGHAVRHTYLININSGETWTLVNSVDDKLSWEELPNYQRK